MKQEIMHRVDGSDATSLSKSERAPERPPEQKRFDPTGADYENETGETLLDHVGNFSKKVRLVLHTPADFYNLISYAQAARGNDTDQYKSSLFMGG